ncbi:N-6 DNA methylase [Acidimicrobiaceae bacterium]|nr:N-6 DNA methylase [Acidimicrobiaceae bacterium]
MLDQETKQRIDNLRDTLVGKVPDPKSQVEQIMISMIYKFMNDMDNESTKLGGKRSFFVDDFEKYSWENLFDAKVSGAELVELYSTAVESMEENPNIPTLFRDIFKNAYIPYKDPETLRLFLSQINEFEYSYDSEQLGDAFEHILNTLSSQGDAGQFRTPRHIIDFIVEILDPKKNETILDPASGTSGFLISAYKHIIKTDTEENKDNPLSESERKTIMKNINGYDISPDMVRIGLANMYLHGFDDPNVFEYDALSSEDRWNEYYDVILANPPFMTPKGGIRPHNKFGLKSNRAEVLFVDYILSHLKPKGRAGIIVPEGIIFQAGKAFVDLRKKLVENGLIGVVSLPAGVFNPYSGVKTSILIIDKSKNIDQVFFGDIQNDGYSLGARRTLIENNDLPSALDEIKSEAFSTIFSLINKSELNTDYSFNFKALSSEDVNSDYKIVELGEHIDVLDSRRKPITKKDRKPGPYPYYGATGIIDYVQDFIFDEEILLLGEDGAKWEAGEKSSFIVDGKSWVNNHAHVIKPKESLNIVYLKEVLNFLDLSKYITGVTVPKLNQKNMLSIKIPLPPIDKQQEIVDEIEQYQKVIDGARQVVESYRPTFFEEGEWHEVKLSEVTELIKRGITPKYSETSGALVINQRCIRDFEVNLENARLHDLEKKSIPEDKKIKQFDVLVNSTGVGTLGRVAQFINEPDESTTVDSHVTIIRLNSELIEDEFFGIAMYKLQDTIELLGRGSSGQTELSASSLAELIIRYPAKKEVQREIIKTIKSEKQTVQQNKNLINKYQNLIDQKIASLYT